MSNIFRFNFIKALPPVVCVVGAFFSGLAVNGYAAPDGTVQASPPSRQQLVTKQKPQLDRSGRTRVGTASFYGEKFNGKKMADGTKMDPNDDNAASTTLPLGTTAKVTNLKTGKSAIVTIQDRGPYVKGRIVDLSPSTAQEIGIARDDGVAKVEVTPIAVPPNGHRAQDGTAPSEPRTQ